MKMGGGYAEKTFTESEVIGHRKKKKTNPRTEEMIISPAPKPGGRGVCLKSRAISNPALHP